ncbi:MULTISPECIES: hypothetical protein [Paenibacillus]|nr:hypothetical protein [Paenibacillus caseinilyticus]MCZ8519589.1 hypothetical protein [Paenibacillus caseinilyticus]
MKTPSALNELDVSTDENELFGTAATSSRLYTRFGLERLGT